MEILRKNFKGFTLLEIIITVAVLGILLSIISLNLKAISQFRANNMKTKILRTAENLRNDSQINNRMNSLKTIKGNNYYIIKKYNESPMRVDLVEGYEFLTSSNITFSPSGIPSDTNSIILKNRDGKLTIITIDVSTGYVRIKEE